MIRRSVSPLACQWGAMIILDKGDDEAFCSPEDCEIFRGRILLCKSCPTIKKEMTEVMGNGLQF